jgi:hypothetical protein
LVGLPLAGICWKEILMRLLRVGLVVCASLWIATCGGSPAAPSTPPSSGPAPASTGQRLAWDQPANSSQEVAAFQFTLFIDGRTSTLSDVQCGSTRAPAGFPCSGRLPTLAAGQHVLEMTAALGGMVSARSAPLTISVASTAADVE